MKEGVVGAKEQVGTVAPGAQVEEELPSALRHFGSISGLEATPLCQRLWARRWVAINAKGCASRVGRPKPRNCLGQALLWGGPVSTAAWSNQSPHVPAKG